MFVHQYNVNKNLPVRLYIQEYFLPDMLPSNSRNDPYFSMYM